MQIRTFLVLTLSHYFFGNIALADTADIREWLVPWPNSAPDHVSPDSRGRVWFVGRDGDYIGNLTPESTEFNRYDLPNGSSPTALLLDPSGIIWYASNKRRSIGSLNPATGRTTEIPIPDRKAKDPQAMVFDEDGNVWFTVHDGNFIGRLNTANHEIYLIPVPTRKTRPHGITFNTKDVPWAIGTNKNVLLRINRSDMSITEIETPHAESRFLQIVATSDDKVWFADHIRGMLGNYDPGSGRFLEWPLPGGSDSRPLGLAVDRNDRIWLVETGNVPNRLVSFDTGSGEFLTESDIPSSVGQLRHLQYHEASGEIWFGTATNTIARIKVH